MEMPYHTCLVVRRGEESAVDPTGILFDGACFRVVLVWLCGSGMKKGRMKEKMPVPSGARVCVGGGGGTSGGKRQRRDRGVAPFKQPQSEGCLAQVVVFFFDTEATLHGYFTRVVSCTVWVGG